MNIKLRAWDNLHDKMIYMEDEGAKFVYENGEWKVFHIVEKNLVRDGIEMDVPTTQEADAEIMLAVNQKDFLDKEIYEGDIRREEIEYDEGDDREYYVCVYIKEWARFAWLNLPGEYNEYLDNGIEHLDETMQETFGIFENEEQETIICGNIYQNSELLKYGGESV